MTEIRSFLILAISLFLCFSPAMAQTTGQAVAPEYGINIAVLDLETIRRKASVVKDIRAQITVFRKGFQADVEREEKALREANQELAKKRTILTPESFAEERRKFEQRVVEVQRIVQQRKQSLAKVRGDAMVQVEGKLNIIITDLAKKLGIVLVLNRSQTIMADRSLEITQDVLAELDKVMPKLQVTAPGN